MKRILPVIISFFILSISAQATHLIGGEMRYAYQGPGTAPNTKRYKITMILFRGDAGGALLEAFYLVGLFNNDNGEKILGPETSNNWRININIPPDIQSVPIILPACIQGAPTLSYTYASYSMIIELPDNQNGYTVTHQTCCRISGMQNLGNSTGSTFTCSIPGTNQLGSQGDSSPAFGVSLNVICKNAPFTLDFSATDPDAGDSLVYSLCNAYNGGDALNTGFVDHAPPPYGFLSYLSPYSGSSPMGSGVTINSATGIISGIAPGLGKYLVNVCISVFRNGLLIANHRKELIVQVSDCELTQSNPMPDFVTCDGFNVQFSQNSTGANTVFWDFGVASVLNDTSNISNPTYTYSDTGLYKVKLIINKGTGCIDSAERTVGVYPGFFPGFIAAGSCFTNPFQFTDTSKANYGVVNNWSWNFGDNSTLADTSHIKNPQWTYPAAGSVTVNFIVTSSKGCRDTVQKVVDILEKPILALAFKDTLICRNDPVQLIANGTGVFNWTPGINIINANTATPTVTPTTTTWYYVNQNDNGCVNNDSVQVRVIPFVSLQAIPDTIICQGDVIQLGATTDGLNFAWTPAANVDNPNILNPVATTTTTTTYEITATVGSCSATDQVVVTTVPYPIANAGPDSTICYNTPAQLHGNIVGSSLTWSPASYLSDPTILNPIATPPRTTTYILSAYDNLGCPKPGRDTVTVIVNPKVNAYAGRDTIVVINQPLQFNGSGGVNYLWSPATALSDPTIFNPVGIYDASIDSIRYKLVVMDDAGCSDSAYVTVKVFKTNPYIFVPSAFTPNNDGLNDVIRPIAVGIQKINYFSIYNRWGQLVFTTTVNGQGWDGRINGQLQGSGVFVWMVSGIDYLGEKFFLKGTVTLIR